MLRRIVLLSDGTGNSSAKVWRTNVWRMFSALDLTSDEQVACYDDGVGSSSFQPSAILGGVFGIGLRRNVIALYKFACRNFKEQGDQIYGFGFSRGAFTIRVTIGLILDQGLIPIKDGSGKNISETELDRLAHQAYRAYHKRHFHTNWGLLLKGIQKLFGKQPATVFEVPEGRNKPVIRFLGLWDTVAAYGLPVDEMTRGVSQWLVPLELPSHTPNPLILRACHALSLDDERTTFHPVLWNEKNEVPKVTPPRFTSDERISQVWFSGVHANVGGGYPDDSLAQIPLYWIMEEARACDLVFKTANPAAIAETREAQDKDGRLYDSRSGMGMYYRYGPRRLSRLCNEIFSKTLKDEVSIPTPKIHESVLRRIQNNAHVYAPIGIPHEYNVVVAVPDAAGSGSTFRIDTLPKTAAAGTAHVYETTADAQARVTGERNDVWPLVWLRALLYFLTLLATIFFVVFPSTGRPDPLGEKLNAFKWVSELIRALAGFLPSWASSWVVPYAQYPKTFLVVVAVIALLLYASGKVAALINDRMTALWKGAMEHKLTPPTEPPSKELSRKEKVLMGLRSSWKDYLGPALSAIAIVYLGLTVGSRLLFTALDDAGLVCNSTEKLSFLPEDGVLVSMNASDLCLATGYKVGRLERYLIWTNPDPAELKKAYPKYSTDSNTCTSVPADPLVNGSVVTDARGYSTFHNADGAELTWWQTMTHILAMPLRRYYGQPWFQPVARYGAVGSEVDFLEPDPDRRVTTISERVTPKVSAELFFYLNDAVLSVPRSYQWLYADNRGCISFFIKPPNK
jgi:uncharacterized protein (DUF2235 family)